MDVGSDDEADELLRVLAHPARRQILRECWHRSVSAGALVDTLDLAAASVSEHLRVLRKSGLVVLTRSGTFRLYRTDIALMRALIHWLADFPHDGQS